MPTAHPIQNNTNAGEISPLLEGRVDLKPYVNGVKRCLNFVPLAQGPITRRPGSLYVAAPKFTAKAARLERFEYSTVQAYVLEFGDLYVRFFRNEGRLENPPGTPIEVITPYPEAEVFNLRTVQSADTLYVTHRTYPQRKLIRNSTVSWSLTQITFLDGPYLSTNTTTTTFGLSGTTGSVTLTASSIVGVNGGTGFQTTDVGRVIRWKDPANNWTWLTITARASTTSVTVTVSGPNASAATATINWRLGVWSDTTGYPTCATFFGDRLYFSGCPSYPDRIDGSNVSDYENFAPTNAAGTVADNNAVSFTLNSTTVNAVFWMADNAQGLLVGTNGAEWVVAASTLGEALTPTNVTAKMQTRYGSRFVTPLLTGKTVLFLQRSGRKIREYLYQYLDGAFEAPDITILSEHITVGGITQMAYQSEPQSIGYMVRGDGTLLSLTYEKAQQVYGWARQVMGGDPNLSMFSSGSVVNPLYSKVESTACIPASSTQSDQVWLLVSRTINGTATKSIEYISPFYIDEDDVGQRYFVDMGAVYNSTPTLTVSGLTWFPNGTTLTVLADGATHPNVVVTGGVITLTRSASIVHVGLGYNSDLWTERINAGAADGTAQGKIKRIHKVVFRFFQTLGLKYGPTEDKLDLYTFRTTADPMSQAVPYLSDDTRDIVWSSGYEKTGRVFIRADQPLPMILLAAMPSVQTQDG